VYAGEKYILEFQKAYTNNGGMVAYLRTGGAANSELSVFSDADVIRIYNGTAWVYSMTFTALVTGTAVLRMYGQTSENNDFMTSPITLRRIYSDHCVSLEYYHGSDLGNIAYQSGLIQRSWLKGFIKNGTHTIEKTGEEKDGVHVPEKIVSRHTHKLKIHVDRGLHRALQTLPLHSTVTITDQGGSEYTALNIDVGDPTWYPKRGLMDVTFTTESDVFVRSQANVNMS
jgi:hypothetical protein